MLKDISTKAKKRNAQKANEVGRVYRMKRGLYYIIYCGKKKVSIYENGNLIYSETGHFYMDADYIAEHQPLNPNMTFDSAREFGERKASWGNLKSHFVVRKSFKNFAEAYHFVDVPDKMEFEGDVYRDHYNGRRWVQDPSDHYRIVIEKP